MDGATTIPRLITMVAGEIRAATDGEARVAMAGVTKEGKEEVGEDKEAMAGKDRVAKEETGGETREDGKASKASDMAEEALDTEEEPSGMVEAALVKEASEKDLETRKNGVVSSILQNPTRNSSQSQIMAGVIQAQIIPTMDGDLVNKMNF